MSDIRNQKRLQRRVGQVEVIERAGGSGSAFPTPESTGYRFFRTDLNLEFVYDGTEWISLNEWAVVLGIDDNLNASYAATTSGVRRGLVRNNLKPRLVRGEAFTFLAAGTSNGANFWTVDVVDANGTIVWSFDTSADAAAGNTIHTTTTFSQPSSAILTVRLDVTKTGAPPNLTPRTPVLFYRIVGT
jgi:hypothetical protein